MEHERYLCAVLSYQLVINVLNMFDSFADYSELILAGGYARGHQTSIWNYNVKKNLWTQIGDMYNPANEVAIAVVKGASCNP